MKRFVDIKTIEPELRRKIAEDPQEIKKIINNHNWKIEGLKDYLLSLTN